MNDTDYEALKARIEKLIDYWTIRLGLKWWDITYGFVRDSGEFKVDGSLAPETLGTCRAMWQYLEAHIQFNMTKIYLQDMTPSELEALIVHELCHALVNEMRTDESDIAHEERVVSTLTKAFIWTRDMAKEEER